VIEVSQVPWSGVPDLGNRKLTTGQQYGLRFRDITQGIRKSFEHLETYCCGGRALEDVGSEPRL